MPPATYSETQGDPQPIASATASPMGIAQRTDATLDPVLRAVAGGMQTYEQLAIVD